MTRCLSGPSGFKSKSCPKENEKARNNGLKIPTIFPCLWGPFGVVGSISSKIMGFRRLVN